MTRMATYCFLIFFTLSILGCNPVTKEQEQIRGFMISQHTNKLPREAVIKQSDISLIEQRFYQYTYHYKRPIRDPFQRRYFSLQKDHYLLPIIASEPQICQQVDCLVVKKSTRSLLESYHLNVLKFVGTIGGSPLVALIKTPDSDVIQVHIGDYLGRNDGKVISINETHVTLQEKVYKSGVMESKKTVLSISR